MFKLIKKEIEWGGRKLTLETGKIARQADGAVLVTYGETSVLSTVVMNREVKEGTDYFPLNVHYKEMFFAAGKIPGGFHKREGRPSEREVIVSRLIDRPIRPLFPESFYNEVQILSTVLSYDGENNPDIVALISASAALAISGIPFLGHIGAARIGLSNGAFVLNPLAEDCESTVLDLVVAGTKDSLLMVEAAAQELPEEEVLRALAFAQENFKPVIDLIDEFKNEAAKGKIDVEMISFDDALIKQIKTLAQDDLEKILRTADKKIRREKLTELKKRLFEAIDTEIHSKESIRSIVKMLEERIVRKNILNNVRIDARDSKTIRNIETEVSVLPRTHGSALFTRGETQALVVTTLGGSQDAQIVDAIDKDTKEHFLLHYNFPAYSVGETGPARAPGRREIGHGKLAWKAIQPVLPPITDFPYTIRVVSEVTESNGSSSMATVCGTTLSLMDAGVPIKNPVAGIAMGLIKEEDKFVVLTDIIGDEDNLGDMDFKVARTTNGITALQMDIKIPGITLEIMESALAQAKEGLFFILGKLSESLTTHRQDVSKYAPSILKLSINKDKIGALIGPGGKNIKEICEKSGAKIDIDDNGIVSVAALGKESMDLAVQMIENIAMDLEIGRIYDGVIKQILDFGAVVTVLSKEGLVHISEISGEKIHNINDVLKVGDNVKVRVLSIDQHKGKIRLSMKIAGNSSQPKECKDSDENTSTCSKPSNQSSDEEDDEFNFNRADTDFNARHSKKPHGRHRNKPGGQAHRSNGRKKFFSRPQENTTERKKKYFNT